MVTPEADPNDHILAKAFYARYLPEPRFHAGSVLMCRDWETETQRVLRARLAARSDWREEMVIGEPDSVGFAVLVHEP